MGFLAGPNMKIDLSGAECLCHLKTHLFNLIHNMIQQVSAQWFITCFCMAKIDVVNELMGSFSYVSRVLILQSTPISDIGEEVF